jgi:hypothetical protein
VVRGRAKAGSDGSEPASRHSEEGGGFTRGKGWATSVPVEAFGPARWCRKRRRPPKLRLAHRFPVEGRWLPVKSLGSCSGEELDDCCGSPTTKVFLVPQLTSHPSAGHVTTACKTDSKSNSGMPLAPG